MAKYSAVVKNIFVNSFAFLNHLPSLMIVHINQTRIEYTRLKLPADHRLLTLMINQAAFMNAVHARKCEKCGLTVILNIAYKLRHVK